MTLVFSPIPNIYKNGLRVKRGLDTTALYIYIIYNQYDVKYTQGNYSICIIIYY